MSPTILTEREYAKVQRRVNRVRAAEKKRGETFGYGRGAWVVRCYRSGRCYTEFRHWLRWSAVITLANFTASEARIEAGCTYRLERDHMSAPLSWVQAFVWVNMALLPMWVCVGLVATR